MTIQDVTDTSTLLLDSRFNGDGIIAENAAEDDDTRQLINEAITCVGSDGTAPACRASPPSGLPPSSTP